MARKISEPTVSGSRGNSISDDTILKISKEIAVKFIEVGRLTPSTFDDTFKDIHRTIKETVDNDE